MSRIALAALAAALFLASMIEAMALDRESLMQRCLSEGLAQSNCQKIMTLPVKTLAICAEAYDEARANGHFRLGGLNMLYIKESATRFACYVRLKAAGVSIVVGR